MNTREPTTDTVNALIFALKDLIVWCDEVLKKYGVTIDH